MRSLSHPLAWMAFLLLLLFGVQVVHAGDAESSDTCINAWADECSPPARKFNEVLCCTPEHPVCATIKGRRACYNISEIPGAGVVARDDGYPTPEVNSYATPSSSSITLDFGDSTTSTTPENSYAAPSSSSSITLDFGDSTTSTTPEENSYATPSSSVAVAPSPWSSVHLSAITVDSPTTTSSTTESIPLWASTPHASSLDISSIESDPVVTPPSTPVSTYVSVVKGISVVAPPDPTTISHLFTGGTVPALNTPVSRRDLPSTTPSIFTWSQLPVIPISYTSVTWKTIAWGTASNVPTHSVVISSTLESRPRWSPSSRPTVSPAARDMSEAIYGRAVDSTTSAGVIVVSGHDTSSVASTTTTYPQVTDTTLGPAYTEPAYTAPAYTETYSPDPFNSLATSNRAPPAATDAAQKLTVVEDSLETFHPLSRITDGSGLFPPSSSSSSATLAARELTSISIAESDVTTITVTNSGTTYPLALITNSAALIPSSCQNVVTATSSTGTPVYYTFVERGCTGGPNTTISSTSTSTSTSHIVISSLKQAGVAAAETSMSSELEETTVSITTTGTCGSAGTVTVTVQATPSTSTVTAWYTTKLMGSSTTSPLVVSSSKAPTSSSESSDPSSSVDAVDTDMSSTMLSSSSHSVATPSSTPLTPTTPNTPGTPTPTVFNGGAGVIQVSYGVLTILFAFLLLQ
ncbi:hypothetical protein SLS55_000111 [Diplodia seriata]|uniref:Extracellular serine-threonine rich protein n=1 Tax=Diplodia seriata TaxID=420778 RepID=A0ABR3CTD2_9PEZI